MLNIAKKTLWYDSLSNFKQQHSFENRLKEANRIKESYPDKIPIICENSPSSKLPNINKTKYLVPLDMSIGQYLYVIRRQLKLPAEKSLILFINGSIPSTNKRIYDYYKSYQDLDGFLYVQYGGENTFGAYKIT